MPPTKKRGRPTGSKNKAKTLNPQSHKPSSRDLADPEYDNEFYDQGDISNVCGFQLNICVRLVHKPCVEKYGDLCECPKLNILRILISGKSMILYYIVAPIP